MPEPTIDLGVYHVDSRPDDDPPWPVRRSLSRVRRWLPVALAVALIAPLASDTTVDPPPIVLLWTAPALATGASVAVGERDLYAVTATADDWVLTAYRLADGTVRWEKPLVPPVDRADVRVVAAPVPMVTDNGFGRTTAYDPATGRPRWIRNGGPWTELGGQLLMLQWGGGAAEFTLVDPPTGVAVGPAVQADLTDSGLSTWAAPDGQAYLFVLGPDRRLTRFQLGSGEVVETAVPGEHLHIVRDLLVVAGGDSDEPAAVAYHAGTLAHRWTVPFGRDAAACGPVVCVGISRAAADPVRLVRGIDPATGASRWSVGCTDSGSFDHPVTCSVNVWAAAAGDLLWVGRQRDDGAAGASSFWLADAATGERVSEPTDWEPTFAADGPSLLLGRYAREDRAVRDPHGEPPMWWARWDPDLSGPDVLGTTGPGRCRAVGPIPYLVCEARDPTGGARVSVWRVNR